MLRMWLARSVQAMDRMSALRVRDVTMTAAMGVAGGGEACHSMTRLTKTVKIPWVGCAWFYGPIWPSLIEAPDDEDRTIFQAGSDACIADYASGRVKPYYPTTDEALRETDEHKTFRSLREWR